MPARQSVEIGHRTSADSGPVGVDAIPQPEASQRRPVGENKQDQAFAVPSPWILPSRTSGMIQASGRSWRTTWSWRAARSSRLGTYWHPLVPTQTRFLSAGTVSLRTYNGVLLPPAVYPTSRPQILKQLLFANGQWRSPVSRRSGEFTSVSIETAMGIG
jgi:hypothetical protein